MEAFEEAGVHGRIEEASFARYFFGAQGQSKKTGQPSARGLSVSAHLCHVLRLCSPKESRRNRTWFSAKEAKLKLLEGRGRDEGKGFARVIDKAVKRLQRAQRESGGCETEPEKLDSQDGLRYVQFELAASYRWSKKTFTPYFQPGFSRVPNAIELPGTQSTQRSAACTVLPFASLRRIARGPRLLTAARKRSVQGS
jgi:hypothetical protein